MMIGEKITLCEMTRELMHKYYSGFETDPDIFMDMSKFFVYKYDAQKVDTRFDALSNDPSRVNLMVMFGDEPIGEVMLKHIDYENKQCELSIHMQNDSVKNKGFGTQAERLALKYAFTELDMKVVLADCVKKNKRSRHVLEKVGFKYVNEDDMFVYFCFECES